MSALFGADDRVVKPRMKLVDWHRSAAARAADRRCRGRGTSVGQARVSTSSAIARTPDMTRELIQIRCDRGARSRVGSAFPRRRRRPSATLDEHWNGRRLPDGAARRRDPALRASLNLAQIVETCTRAQAASRGACGSRAAARHLVRPGARGARAAWRARRRVVARCDRGAAARRRALEPVDRDDRGRLDLDIARAFAEIIDAKTPYTFRHSAGVADFAVRIGAALGFDADAQRGLRRAGLLHDIGKLGVSNRILDKPGTLDRRGAAP